jgi:hypothetical protein
MKKTIFILTLIITTQLYAQSKVDSLEKCLSATDSIDREYCHKKRAKAIEQGFFENYKKWEAGYSQADKDKASSDIQKQIEMKKEIQRLTQEEITIQEQHLAKVAALPSNEEKEKAKQDQDKAKGDEQKDKVKKLFKKIF